MIARTHLVEEAVIEVVLVTAEEAEVDLVAVTDVDGAVQEAGTDDPGPVVEIEDDHAVAVIVVANVAQGAEVQVEVEKIAAREAKK